MVRNTSPMVALFVALVAAGDARAQYGWNGWGATAGGNQARGLGNLYAGRGALNESNAVAGAINANTTMRWNNALYQSSQASARQYNAHNRYEMQKVNRDRAEVRDRIRNHPEQRDITDGDALNLLLTELLDPKNLDRSLTKIRTPIKSEMIRDIPFEYASEDITLCLDQMTMDDQWPLALKVDSLKPERAALKAAITKAMKADEEGSLDPEMIAAVQAALAALTAKFKQEVPQSSPDYYPARDTLKAMSGLTKILHSPKLEQVLAELEDYQGTTLGDLLTFMQSFNLRFAPSNSFRQRGIYLKLYPMLAEQANGPGPAAGAGDATAKAAGEKATATEKASGDAAGGVKAAATDLFRGLGDD